MRRSISRALFVFVLAASGMAVLLLVASSMRIAYAQVRPGRGGGGGGGVNLQATTPGTMQTGHINISGTLALNGTSATTGSRIVAAGNTLSISSASAPGAGQPVAQFFSGGSVLLGIGTTNNAMLRFTGTDGLPTTIGTATAPSSLRLQGQPLGTVPSVVVDTTGATTAPLLDVRNNGVSQFKINSNGATNGQAFATAITAGAITVSGSSCAILTVSGFTGLGAGGPCIAYADNVWGTLPVSMTCEQASATTANIRFCNTGVNPVTLPAGTYSARIP